MRKPTKLDQEVLTVENELSLYLVLYFPCTLHIHPIAFILMQGTGKEIIRPKIYQHTASGPFQAHFEGTLSGRLILRNRAARYVRARV